MQKTKNVILLLLILTIFTFCIGACGVEQPSETSGPQNMPTTTEPVTGEEPPENPEVTEGNAENNKQPDRSEENEDNDESNQLPDETDTPAPPITPDNEETGKDDQPLMPEKPDEPSETDTPAQPVEPDGDEDSDNTDIITPPEPEKPDTPDATELAEGESVIVDGAEFIFTADATAYYTVKISGDSANGALYLNGKTASAGTDSEFYLYAIQLSEGETLTICTEVCGGEISVFKAAEMQKDGAGSYYASTTAERQYFVFIAERDGDFTFEFMLNDFAEAFSLGTCCVADNVFYDNGEDISYCTTFTLKTGDIIAVWAQSADVDISIF